MDTQNYFTELSRHLRRDGLTPAEPRDGLMPVILDGQELCQATAEGGIRYKPEIRQDPKLERILDHVTDTASTVTEYMKLLEVAPPLKAVGLDEADGYRLLSDFNGTVLAGKQTTYGAQFVTWDWNYEHTGLGHGHYYDNYKAAKRDFATRSGLVPENRLFTPEQLAEVYRCVYETLENERGYPMTAEREQLLKRITDQIERGVPDLDRLVELSNQQELEAGNGPMDGMTQQF